jgi:uncharacterized protein (DUF697 family)
MGSKPKLAPKTLLSAVRELRARESDRRPIVVDGARGLVPLLVRELRAGGDSTAVREGGSAAGAAALVWMGYRDDERLRAASRAGVPIVGVTDGESLPYVLDTDLVTIAPGEALPVEKIARVLARQLGSGGPALAARLPVLREPVVDALIRGVSRQNAAIAAAVWVPGVDMPILTLNQARLVRSIALAHGHEFDRSRLPELAGVVGAGFGLRAVARQLLGLVPVAGWAAQGAVAYGGTRAIGEAARRRFTGS